ncbi:SMI1/KNR4 family protein [Dactylosporangium sp. NPDC005572]|uniref:SMI1/KNR4 family protein n=1 Tax=Dactylosporangium sp. NPDC005572 TaxID=3156889 RepID=UPI0033B4C7C0
MAPFDEIVASFWHPTSTHGRRPPLTDDLVATAECVLGVRLPDDLLRLLRIQNGGGVAEQWDACPAEVNGYADDHVPFEHLFGLDLADRPGALTLLDTPYLVREWELPSPCVLLSGQGHFWVALDYRACGPTGVPSVAWIDNELGHELRLAPDFRAFVERLVPGSRVS